MVPLTASSPAAPSPGSWRGWSDGAHALCSGPKLRRSPTSCGVESSRPSLCASGCVKLRDAVRTAVELAAEFDELSRETRQRRRKQRPHYGCFSSSHPIGDVWTHLTRTRTKHIYAVHEVFWLHPWTSRADHGKKMDTLLSAKTDHIYQLSSISVICPALFHEPSQLPSSSGSGWTSVSALFSSMCFPGANDILACNRTVLELLVPSHIVDRLYQWADKSGVVPATDKFIHCTAVISLLRENAVFTSERTLCKETSDTYS